MQWLEKHIDGFFKLNGALIIIGYLIGALATIKTFGWPSNSISTWTSYQWHMMKFFWGQDLILIPVLLTLVILCFKKRYFVFPFILVYSFNGIKAFILSLNNIIITGTVYPLSDLSCIIAGTQFILSILGTLLWIRKTRNDHHSSGKSSLPAWAKTKES